MIFILIAPFLWYLAWGVIGAIGTAYIYENQDRDGKPGLILGFIAGIISLYIGSRILIGVGGIIMQVLFWAWVYRHPPQR